MERLHPPPEPSNLLWTFIKALFGKIPIVGWLIDMFTGVFDPHPDTGSAPGASSEIRERLGFGSTMAKLRWDQIDDLQSDTQKLLGVIGYGSARMSGDFTPGTAMTRIPFRTRIGPMVGMTFDAAGGYFVLGSAGLWEFSAKVIWDFLTGPVNKGCFMDVAVYAPNGTIFYRARNLFESETEATMNETGRFVVPASGYRVEIQGAAGTGYRGLLGNNGYSQLNLLKISDETS